TASNLSSKDRASGSSAPLRARFDTRPQRGSTRTGCWPLPKNDEVPPEILHSSREPEMEREHIIEETCRIRTVTSIVSVRPLHVAQPLTAFLSFQAHGSNSSRRLIGCPSAMRDSTSCKQA